MRPSLRVAPALTALLAAACTDEPAPPDPLITVDWRGTSWAAVRVGDTWTRHDDVPFSFSVAAGARYQIVGVCRTDIGWGWTVLGVAGAPGSEARHDETCAFAEPEADAGPIPVEVAVTGRVDYVFVGARWAPTAATLMVEPGTYDVLAYHQPTGPAPDGRVTIMRDVVIDGPRRVDLDLEHGADLARAQVYLDGAPTSRTTATTTTATGATIWSAGPARVLPPALARATDRVAVTVEKDGYWAELDYRGPLHLQVPTEATTASFRWDPVPTAELTTEGAWDRVTLDLRDRLGLHTWRVVAAPAFTTLAVEAPPFADWNPAWLPTAADATWEVRWERARPDGRHGLRTRTP